MQRAERGGVGVRNRVPQFPIIENRKKYKNTIESGTSKNAHCRIKFFYCAKDMTFVNFGINRKVKSFNVKGHPIKEKTIFPPS